jgi:hypothetical protein
MLLQVVILSTVEKKMMTTQANPVAMTKIKDKTTLTISINKMKV